METFLQSMWEPCLRFYNREPLCLRHPLNKKLFPVHRPSGLKRADWDFFSMIFEKKVFFLILVGTF